MKKILSIDFDYFIDTDLDTRNNKFPDGVDEKPTELLKEEWNLFLNKYPEIKDIGVINEYYEVLDYLKTHKFNNIIVGMSHSMIERIFSFTDEDFFVTHIDFHHDCYISGGETLDCANWVRILKEQRPNSEVLWIRREDSETSSLMGVYPYKSTTELILEDSYDYLFICLSPEWTPPQLTESFLKLVSSADIN